jgi:hypothetical protein
LTWKKREKKNLEEKKRKIGFLGLQTGLRGGIAPADARRRRDVGT